MTHGVTYGCSLNATLLPRPHGTLLHSHLQLTNSPMAMSSSNHSKPVEDRAGARSGKPRSSSLAFLLVAVLPVLTGILVWNYRSNTGALPSPLPRVITKQGTFIGNFVDDGTFPKELEGFMGIPYAHPPVGERRFRTAELLPASNETVEAYYLGPR